MTTEASSGCTSDSDRIQGTSFSTPIATGIIALALEAKYVLYVLLKYTHTHTHTHAHTHAHTRIYCTSE
jgi:subtilisin family serine protease